MIEAQTVSFAIVFFLAVGREVIKDSSRHCWERERLQHIESCRRQNLPAVADLVCRLLLDKYKEDSDFRCNPVSLYCMVRLSGARLNQLTEVTDSHPCCRDT